MTEEQIDSIYIAIKSLPQEAQNWLNSDEINRETALIAQQFILSDKQKIKLMFIILRLAAQNLPPENFKQEMVKVLVIDQNLAGRITDALKEKVFAPIEQPLKIAGVDINLLKYNAPSASSGQGHAAPAATQAPFTPSIPKPPAPENKVMAPPPSAKH